MKNAIWLSFKSPIERCRIWSIFWQNKPVLNLFHFWQFLCSLHTLAESLESVVPKFCQSRGEMEAASPRIGLTTELWLLFATIKRSAQADVLKHPTFSFWNRMVFPHLPFPTPKFKIFQRWKLHLIKGQLVIIYSWTDLGERVEIQRWLKRLLCKGKIESSRVFLQPGFEVCL